jgi:hypothetical protein
MLSYVRERLGLIFLMPTVLYVVALVIAEIIVA